MERANIVEFGDLLRYAEGQGFPWNYAHEMLDDYYPSHESTVVYCSELECYGYSLDYKRDWLKEDAKKYNVEEATYDIIRGFCQKHGITDFRVIT